MLMEAEAALDAAMEMYLNAGGTVERAHARLDGVAARLLGEGQQAGAERRPGPNCQPRQGDAVGCSMPQGRTEFAASPHDPASAGAAGHVDRAAARRFSSALGDDPAPAGGDGAVLVMPQGQRRSAPLHPHSLRGPTPTERAAVAKVAQAVAIAYLDVRVHEVNCRFGDLERHTVEALASRNGDRAYVYRRVLEQWQDGARLVRDCISEQQLQVIAKSVPSLAFPTLIGG